MKLKKVKQLLGAINSIASRDIKEIKGIYNTKAMLDETHPLVLLPTKGKYCLPEVKTITKIVTSIEPDELVETARKVNFQTKIHVLSVMIHPVNPNFMLVLVHTPYGCCAYDAIMDPKDNKMMKEIPEKNIQIDFDDENLKDKFEIL